MVLHPNSAFQDFLLISAFSDIGVPRFSSLRGTWLPVVELKLRRKTIGAVGTGRFID
jgi:hypothetical protein